MSTLKTAATVAATTSADTDFPAESWENHTARCTTHWGRSGAVVTLTGELDAANADQFAEFVERCAAYCEWLVLDLGGLAFMGTAGFAMLHIINTRCAGARVHWALVPGAAASRLLRICDPAGTLPTAKTVRAGLAQVQDHRLLQLVSEPS